MSGWMGLERELDSGVADPATSTFVVPEARGFFDGSAGLMDLLGWDTAANNVRRYRSGQGGTRTNSSEEIDRHPALGKAEDVNRTRFESRTFVGQTDKSAFNRSLSNLAHGETMNFADHWDSNFSLSRPSTYFAFGQSGARSRGQFEVRRNGEDMEITGTVTHGMRGPREDIDSETYDFNPGQVGSGSAAVLEPIGEAAPFQMRYSREQDVSAQVRRAPDGSLTLRRATWGPLR